MTSENSIDASLARGLRNAMIKRILTNRPVLEDQLVTRLIEACYKIPNGTCKGRKKIFRTLSKYAERDAVHIFEDLYQKRYGHILLWDVEKVVEDGWEEHLIGVTHLFIDTMTPTFSKKVETSVKFGSHLISRIFQRVKTANIDRAFDNLRDATLAAFAMERKLLEECLQHCTVKMDFPVMIPTRDGFVTGDLIYDPEANNVRFDFRTFLIQETDKFASKIEFGEKLKEWQSKYSEYFVRIADFSLKEENETKTQKEIENSKIVTQMCFDFIHIHMEYSDLPARKERRQKQREKEHFWREANRAKTSDPQKENPYDTNVQGHETAGEAGRDVAPVL